MYRHLKVYLVALMLLVTLATLGGSVSGYPTSETNFYFYEDEKFVNETVLATYYRSDDRTTNYFFESFDGSGGTYDIIDGVSDPSRTGKNWGAKKTNVDSESFDWGENTEPTGAMWFNFTDGGTADSSGSAIWFGNGTLDVDVRSFELDFLLEDDTEAVSICSTGWVLRLFCVNFTADDGNATVHTGVTTPEKGGSFNRSFDSGKWHHMIFSVVNDLVNGFEMTIFIDNASVVIEDSKQSGLGADIGFQLYPLTWTGAAIGRDIVIDNLVVYNGSFNSSEISSALSGTSMSLTLQGILPVMVTLAVVGMIIGIVKKVESE